MRNARRISLSGGVFGGNPPGKKCELRIIVVRAARTSSKAVPMQYVVICIGADFVLGLAEDVLE